MKNLGIFLLSGAVFCYGQLFAMNPSDGLEQELGLMGNSAQLAERYLKEIADGTRQCDEEVAQFIGQDELLERIMRDERYLNLFAIHTDLGRPFARCILSNLDMPISEFLQDTVTPSQAIVIALLYHAYFHKKDVSGLYKIPHLQRIIKSLANINELAFLIPAAAKKQRAKEDDAPMSGGSTYEPIRVENPLLPWQN